MLCLATPISQLSGVEVWKPLTVETATSVLQQHAKGLLKVLASESVYFEVEGPGEIIDNSAARNNPAKTEFGTATVLLRATTQPGNIKVKAHVQGLKSGGAVLTSVAPAQPLAYAAACTAASKAPAQGTMVVIQNNDQGGADVKKLKQELQRLQNELTGKFQDQMELRSTRENRSK